MKKNKVIKESKWVEDALQPAVQEIISKIDSSLQVMSGKKLPYLHCITQYDKNNKPTENEMQSYETDLLIIETNADGNWSPRLVIETKLRDVTTHDAITYSQKASTHKNIHPYLRYGILVADYETPLPGRLIVHGSHFDFMMVWKSIEPDNKETEQFIKIIRSEIEASRQIEELIRTRRTKNKKAVYSLHRKLELGY